MIDLQKTASAPRYRYWFTPPETIAIRVSDIEGLIPESNRLRPFEPDQYVTFLAAEIFVGNVPKISFEFLSKLLPDQVSPSRDFLLLPIARVAAAYHFVEQREELPTLPDTEAEDPELELSDEGNFISEKGDSELGISASSEMKPPEVLPDPIIPSEEASSVQSPEISGSEKSSFKRAGIFSSLPIFRRKSAPVASQLAETVPEISSSMAADLPVLEDSAKSVISPVLSEAKEIPLEKKETVLPPQTQFEALKAPKEKGELEILPARFIETEHFSSSPTTPEISDQEPLQGLFLTEENMTLNRVIELCGSLPGINSCVLTHGTVVVAAHNVPESVDLVSMSAHAADMLHAMRESSARMGVGTVPAVTLHTEKGVISFFHQDDLTMLVFHKDRGFVPGVREKMAAVLRELTKAPLMLPIGGERRK